jgi:putative flippase GtrA
MTALSLAILHANLNGSSPQLELAVLTAANLLGTVVRFVLLRTWVFRARSVPAVGGEAPRALTSRDKVMST